MNIVINYCNDSNEVRNRYCKPACSVWNTMSLKCVDGLLGLGDYLVDM